MSFFLNTMDSHRGDSKHYNMMEFIRNAKAYIKTKSEDSENLMHRHLQLLSVTTDYSIFDSNTSVVCEFFVTLHWLLNNLETRSSLVWCSVNVLNAACRNPDARQEIVNTYEFIPPLSRFLGDHLSDEKKVNLLTILQELSWGMQISWQIPHLTQLIAVLIQWIEKEKNEQIITLCLGVLINLCYKNPIVIYSLSKCRDIKQFIRDCLSLKVKEGSKLEVSICKMLLILDYDNGIMPNNVFLKLISSTFKSMKEALESKDATYLKQIVEFYLDVKSQNERNEVDVHNVFVYMFVNYAVEIKAILDLIDNKIDVNSQTDGECMSSVFKFLRSLVELRLPNFMPTYPQLINLSLKWHKPEYIGTEAFSLLTAICLNTKSDEKHIFELLYKMHSVLIEHLQNIEADTVMNIDLCKKTSCIVQLLKCLVSTECTRERMLKVLDEKMVDRVFLPLLGNGVDRKSMDDNRFCSVAAVLLYVNTLVLLYDLASFDVAWVDPLNMLLQHKQIHAVLSQGLYSGNEEIRAGILSMAAISFFPRNELAVVLHEMRPCIKTIQKNLGNAKITKNNLMGFPLMKNTELDDKLLEINNKFKETEAQGSAADISTSDIMALYEHKLSSINQTKQFAKTIEDTAMQYRTNLENLTSGLNDEISRMKQALFRKQKQQGDQEELNQSMKRYCRDLKNTVEAQKGRCKMVAVQLKQKEEQLVEKDEQESELRKLVKEREEENAGLEEENTKMKAVVLKMEENLKVEEKKSDSKDVMIKNVNANVEHLKLQLIQMERQLKQTEMELRTMNEEHDRVKDELMEKSQLVEAITKLTRSRK